MFAFYLCLCLVSVSVMNFGITVFQEIVDPKLLALSIMVIVNAFAALFEVMTDTEDKVFRSDQIEGELKKSQSIWMQTEKDCTKTITMVAKKFFKIKISSNDIDANGLEINTIVPSQLSDGIYKVDLTTNNGEIISIVEGDNISYTIKTSTGSGFVIKDKIHEIVPVVTHFYILAILLLILAYTVLA